MDPMAENPRSTASQVSDLLVEAQQADQSSVFRRQARHQAELLMKNSKVTMENPRKIHGKSMEHPHT